MIVAHPILQDCHTARTFLCGILMTKLVALELWLISSPSGGPSTHPTVEKIPGFRQPVLTPLFDTSCSEWSSISSFGWCTHSMPAVHADQHWILPYLIGYASQYPPVLPQGLFVSVPVSADEQAMLEYQVIVFLKVAVAVLLRWGVGVLQQCGDLLRLHWTWAFLNQASLCPNQICLRLAGLRGTQ